MDNTEIPKSTLTPPPGERRSVSLPPSSRYEIAAELGHGGMGTVYRGRHCHLDKPVAIKVIKPGLDSERFLREARLLAKVASPHVVAVHDFDILPDGSPMLVMELIEGSDLRQRIEQQDGPLDEVTTLEWMRQTAMGLQAAAEQGIIHRDVKPSNIFIDRHNRARVLDFGLSRTHADSGSLTLTDSCLGTPFYMAPEQAENPRTVDTRADIYSFGATFYHALTGRPPFMGDSPFAVLFKHKTAPLIAPQSLNPSLTKGICEVLERCLAKSPHQRFDTFADVLRVLHLRATDVSPWDELEDRDIARHLDGYRRRREAYLQRMPRRGDADVYFFPNNRRLKILVGDITRIKAEAIVSPDNSYLTMDYGCALAIHQSAGNDVLQLAQQFTPARPGRVVVTPAGKLRARFVFHAITNGYTDRFYHPTRDFIAELVSAILYQADTLSVRTLALPLLAAGGAGLPEDVALDAVFHSIVRHLHRGLTAVQRIYLVLYSPAARGKSRSRTRDLDTADSAPDMTWTCPLARRDLAAAAAAFKATGGVHEGER